MTGTTATRLVDQEELTAQVLRMRRVLFVGMLVWPLFLVLDWFASRAFEQSFAPGAIVRMSTWIVAAPVVIRLYWKPVPGASVVRALDLIVFAIVSVSMALMALLYGGISSPYLGGGILVFLSRACFVAEPFRRGTMSYTILFAALFGTLFLVGMAAGGFLEEFRDPRAAFAFAAMSGSTLVAGVIAAFGADVVWRLRRRLFESRRLGRYRLGHRIGIGGMGEVWVARHEGLGHDVAVKVLRQDMDVSESSILRFEREARAIAGLSHPNTIRILDHGRTEDGILYYTMELLNGTDLGTVVGEQGPLPVARAVHIMVQACRAVGEAHTNKIVHRDIKPENLFLTSAGGVHDFVKVLDFGIAKVTNVDAEGTGLTQTGSVLGTPRFMSPEGARGDVVDARSDVYALGAVLYFLVAGHPPFQLESVSALLLAHLQQTPARPSTLEGVEVPEDVEAIIMRCLHKDPSARPANGIELAVALETCSVGGTWTPSAPRDGGGEGSPKPDDDTLGVNEVPT